MTAVAHAVTRGVVGDRRLRIAIIVVCLLGIGDAGYLTYVHYAGLKVVCLAGGGGCETVQASRYAKLGGVPVAVLGLIGYISILGSTFIRGELGRAIGVAIAFVGLLLQHVPDLPRAVHDPRDLSVVRRQRRADDGPRNPHHRPVPARRRVAAAAGGPPLTVGPSTRRPRTAD